MSDMATTNSARSPLYEHIVRVPFVDTDMSGRIHFSAVLRYFELAEVAMLSSFGMNLPDLMRHFFFPRVHVEADYLGAIEYDDELLIAVNVTRLGQTSITYHFKVRARHRLSPTRPEQMLRAGDEGFDLGAQDPVVATGTLVMACVDRDTFASAPLPEGLRAQISARM